MTFKEKFKSAFKKSGSVISEGSRAAGRDFLAGSKFLGKVAAKEFKAKVEERQIRIKQEKEIIAQERLKAFRQQQRTKFKQKFSQPEQSFPNLLGEPNKKKKNNDFRLF